ncbi:hypothetical protein DOY81_014252 [Sarcophaga bullata]|nr:hypothetical protein DOY81_014252 [Sarcophaga bullata]
MHHANRDAQDDKDETPLFLAAREGSYEACKALLDNFANREIMIMIGPFTSRCCLRTLSVTDMPSQSSPGKAAKKAKLLEGSPDGLLDNGGSLRRKPSSKKGLGQASKKGNNSSNLTASQLLNGLAGGQTVQNPGSVENQQQQLLDAALSSVDSPPPTALTSQPSPYDTTSMYSNAMTGGGGPPTNNNHHNDLLGNSNVKHPPSYEDCVKNAQSMQSLVPQQSHDMIKMENYGYSMGSPFHQELMNGNQNAANGLNGNNLRFNRFSLSPCQVKTSLATSPHPTCSNAPMNNASKSNFVA